MHRALALGLVAVLALPACARDERAVVLVASSLTDVAEALVEASGVDAVVSAAGSQTLAAQIRAGAPADVILLADPDLAAALARDGDAGEAVVVATTSLAIAVRSSVADTVLAPRDLADPSLRVVLADEDVPLGRYTRQALASLEDDGRLARGTTDAVLAGADSFEDAARSVLAKVTTGEADAAVVFAVDERLAPSLVFVPWPEEVTAAYTVQVVRGSTAAARFAEFVTGQRAEPVWRRFGFAIPGR